SLFTYDCLATELAAELALQHRHSHSAKLRDLATTGHFPSNLVRAKRTISERALDSTLNIDDVASAAGLSKFHFIRSFRQHVGTTPRQYLNALRLDLAKDSLAKGNSVLETALANGFCSVSGFNKAFRRGAGMTPKRSRASL
ncbi:MAG: helix-turn-helix domain-containing protein, partial [Bdellovibrionota bacterium]